MVKFLIPIVLLNLIFLNISVYYAFKNLNKQVCVVDIQRIVNYFSTMKPSKEEANVIVKLSNQFIEQSGCDYVFLKGALLHGRARNITDEVISYVSKAFTSK